MVQYLVEKIIHQVTIFGLVHQDYKKFALPKELENYYKNYPHGATLCEIRSGAKQIQLVPETKYHTTNEIVKWVKYDGIDEYPGNIQVDAW